LLVSLWPVANGVAAEPAALTAQSLEGRIHRPLTSVSLDPSTGFVRFLRFRPQPVSASAPEQAPSPLALDEKASSFLAEHAEIFGLEAATAQLGQAVQQADFDGSSHLTYPQVHRGIAVFGGVLRLHFDRAGELTAVNGAIVPTAGVPDEATLTRAEAERAALAAVTGAAPGRVLSARLVVYNTGLGRGARGYSHLAWEIDVRPGESGHEWIFVDATAGRILDRLPGVHEALSREILRGPLVDPPRIWREGNKLPFFGSGSVTGDAAVNRLITETARSYRLFENLSDGQYLSFDGKSATMGAIFEGLPESICPNAAWDGERTRFCASTSVDDVVGHEWTHGYTQHTAGLIYRWQAGALNESFSDIFGETQDLLVERSDETENPRDTGTCTTARLATHPTLTVLAPAAQASTISLAVTGFDAGLAAQPVEGVVVAARDTQGRMDGCVPVVNARQLKGKIALMSPWNCAFETKILNAQKAGAAAVLFTGSRFLYRTLGRGDNSQIRIPAALITSFDTTRLYAWLGKGLKVRLSLEQGTGTSRRWLNGEDGTEGIFRDMWAPNCVNNPATVLDEVFFCSSHWGDDGGGVHFNSGVPNFTYALFVDGGEFQGKSFRGAGLTKAAHIYWRALRHYHTPTGDFAEHADALEQSCSDLASARTNLPSLSRRGPSGEVISVEDCADLAEVLEAVSMRSTPACRFAPILRPESPPLCPSGELRTDSFTDFESSATGWKKGAVKSVASDKIGPLWTLRERLPQDRTGRAFFAAGPPEMSNGLCPALRGENLKYLESPPFVLGPGRPQLAFEHYFLGGIDRDMGSMGRLRVSVNGGPYANVPDTAIHFNSYSTDSVPMLLFNRGYSPVWTSANDGELESNWGQTLVDISGLASPTDTVRFRFELVAKFCHRYPLEVGWFIDDVRLFSCAGEESPTCVEDGQALCLGGGRYRVTADWYDYPAAREKRGVAQPLTPSAGFFLDPDTGARAAIVQLERSNGNNALSWAALGDGVLLDARVKDLVTGTVRSYRNDRLGGGYAILGRPQSCGDTLEFSGFLSARCVPGPNEACLSEGRFLISGKLAGAGGALQTVEPVSLAPNVLGFRLPGAETYGYIVESDIRRISSGPFVTLSTHYLGGRGEWTHKDLVTGEVPRFPNPTATLKDFLTNYGGPCRGLDAWEER
jgi:Zn-dependent metalloprotease